MPDWLLPLITHGGLGLACAILFFAWTRERIERLELSKAQLDLTRDLVTVSQQMVNSIQINTGVTKDTGDQLSRVTEKLDFILQKRR